MGREDDASMHRVILGTIALALLIGVLAAANLRRGPDSQPLDWQLIPVAPREVITEPPRRGTIIQTITAPGAVELVEEAQIASQIVGRVVEVSVQDGDLVKGPRGDVPGDLLVRLDATDAEARLRSAVARIDRLKAAVEQATSELEKADRDLRRSRELAGRGVMTPTELADVRTTMAKAESALTMSRNEREEAEAMRTSAQQELDRTQIRAPIDGVVAGIDVEVGEVVIAGTTNLPGTVLMTIGNPARMRARADVDETDVTLVKPGQVARVFLQADPVNAIPGHVELVAPKGKKTEDVVSFETLVAVEVTENTPLRPGMTATVEIEVERADDALSVPVQAVVHRRRKELPDTPEVSEWAERHARAPGEKAMEAEARYIKIVFVNENGIARARPVETGLSDERRVEVRSGLGPDDRVIVGPFRALEETKDGDRLLKAVEPLPGGKP